MTPQQLVGLGLRLFGVWMALASLSGIVTFVVARSDPGAPDAAAFMLVVPLFYLLVAACAWLFPMSLAHRLIPKTRFDNVLSPQALELARVGTALLGLWVLATTAPAVGAILMRVTLFEASNQSYFGALSPDQKFKHVEVFLQFLAGVTLVAASARIAEFMLPERDGADGS